MTCKSSALGLVALVVPVVFGACSDGGNGEPLSSSSGSYDPPAAVVVRAKDVPENLLIRWHYPGNSCANPLGGATPEGSVTSIVITLLPSQQAVGTYPLCEISERTAYACDSTGQCTGSSASMGSGTAGSGGGMATGKLEILSIDDKEVTFTMTDVGSCDWGTWLSTSPQHDGTYTAPRCN